MTFRFSSRTIFGAAALLSLGASLAVAQDTTRTRSQRRIPVSKEAPGEVVRVDTLMIYRTDTLTQLRVDTVRRTVVRVDTVTKFPPPMRLVGGWYFGLAGGVSEPAGALFTPNSGGPSGQAQVGYQPAYSWWGGRLDVNYTHPGEDSRFSGFESDAQIWNTSLNLKLQAPWFSRIMGGFGHFALYGIGGFTWTAFRNLPMRIDNPFNSDVPLFLVGNCSNNNIVTTQQIRTINGNQLIVNNLNNDNSVCNGWHSRGGWNAGGGASLSWRRTELFIESRVIAFNPSNAPQARQIPTVFGINFY